MDSSNLQCAVQNGKSNQEYLLSPVENWAIKGWTFVNATYEVEGTEHVTENTLRVTGKLLFPIVSGFMETIGNTVQESDEISKKIKKLLMDDLKEVGFLSKDNKNSQHNLNELNTGILYSNSTDFENIPLLYANSLHFSVFYFIDDILDKTLENSDEYAISDKVLKIFMNTYLAIMDDNPVEYVDFRSQVQCQKDGNALNILVKLVQRFRDFLKSNFTTTYSDRKLRKPLIELWHSWFLANTWFRKFRLEREICTDEIYFALRNCSIAYHIAVEFWSLLKNIVLEDIRNDPIFERIMRAACIATGLLNDLMGFSREFNESNAFIEDNYILLKHRQGMPLELAFKRAEEIIAKECKIFITFEQKLREEHPENQNLQKYCDICDFLLCNMFPFHAKMPRYTTKCWINGIAVAKFNTKSCT